MGGKGNRNLGYLLVYYCLKDVSDKEKTDTAKKTFSMWDIGGKVIHHYAFDYDPSEKNNLTLSGKFKDYDVKITMKPVMDSMYLNMEKTKLVAD